MNLNGTSAIVSGSASGLALATTRALVEAGAQVAVLDASLEALDAARRELGVLPLTCDVTDANGVQAAFVHARTAPGVFEVPMVATMPQEAQAAQGNGMPLPCRLGRLREDATLPLHIATNPTLNGEVNRLDGAHRMSAR
ncbi:MAG TPA: SDR family NAD(P)-dependent oxidoreductase [Methylibium sp.]|nr:SDR family NAD(P)-dependent oxidoreductase [Methylibium sp.]